MDSLEEFSRKYMDTYIKYITLEDKKINSAKVLSIDLSYKKICLFVYGIGDIIINYPKGLQNLNLDSPKSGFFNFNNHAIYLFKVPARQWKRGLCSDNYEFYNPFKCFFKSGVYCPMFGDRAIQAIINPEYLKIHETIINLESNPHMRSIAINPNIMLSKSPVTNNREPLIWYKTTPVGFIQSGKFSIQDELYEQEIHDELTRMNEGQWIS